MLDISITPSLQTALPPLGSGISAPLLACICTLKSYTPSDIPLTLNIAPATSWFVLALYLSIFNPPLPPCTGGTSGFGAFSKFILLLALALPVVIIA